MKTGFQAVNPQDDTEVHPHQEKKDQSNLPVQRESTGYADKHVGMYRSRETGYLVFRQSLWAIRRDGSMSNNLNIVGCPKRTAHTMHPSDKR